MNGWSALTLLGMMAVAKADQLQESDLKLKPPVQCKGSGRPAPTMKESVRAESVGAPAAATDLNGDGWCDWIVALPYPSNTQLPEHSAREAILLGTEKGARVFGDLDKLKLHWKKRLPVPPGLVLPDGVTGMAPALVAYSSQDKAPYFLGLSRAYPEYWSDADSYKVYKWNQEFDTPQIVSDAEYVTVMKFWRKQYCEGKKYSNQEFLHPDSRNFEHPLEILVCSPWTDEAVRRVEGGLHH